MHIERWKTVLDEILHDNTWWKYRHAVFELEDGQRGDYFYADLHGFSLVIPVLSDGRIIMTIQYRYLSDKQSIEFTAGKIEDGSDPLETAQQELEEETGWIADEYIKVGIFEPSNGYTKNICHVFLAQAYEQKETHFDKFEQIESLYRRPDEIDEMIRRNDIWCGSTMAAWAMVRHHFLGQDEAKISGPKFVLPDIL